MSDDDKSRRAPNRTSWKPGGPSPNPAGRPRRGNALAEVVRSKIPPDVIVGVVAKLLTSADEKVRIAAATWLRDTAYPKPESRIELDVVDARQLDAQRIIAELSTDALRELVDVAERQERNADPLPILAGNAVISDGDVDA